MGIWHSRQTTSLRGNRFYRRPERSHCFGLSLFRQSSLKQKCATSMRSNALLEATEERELHCLPDAVVSSFMRDARRVPRALAAVTGAPEVEHQTRIAYILARK